MYRLLVLELELHMKLHKYVQGPKIPPSEIGQCSARAHDKHDKHDIHTFIIHVMYFEHLVLTVKSQLMYPWYYLVCTFTYFSHTPDFSKPLFVVPPFDCWGQVFHPSQHDCIGVESLFFQSMIVMQNNSVHRRCPR